MTIIRKSPGATALPNKLFDEWIFNMTGAELKIILSLERIFANQSKDFIFSIENFKKSTGLSQPAISKAIDRLIQKGLLEKKRTGKEGKEKTIYTFNWWKKNEETV